MKRETWQYNTNIFIQIIPLLSEISLDIIKNQLFQVIKLFYSIYRERKEEKTQKSYTRKSKGNKPNLDTYLRVWIPCGTYTYKYCVKSRGSAEDFRRWVSKIKLIFSIEIKRQISIRQSHSDKRRIQGRENWEIFIILILLPIVLNVQSNISLSAFHIFWFSLKNVEGEYISTNPCMTLIKIID